MGILKAREPAEVLSDSEGNLQAITIWMGSELAYYSWGLKFSRQHCKENKFFSQICFFFFLTPFIWCVSVNV